MAIREKRKKTRGRPIDTDAMQGSEVLALVLFRFKANQTRELYGPLTDKCTMPKELPTPCVLKVSLALTQPASHTSEKTALVCGPPRRLSSCRCFELKRIKKYVRIRQNSHSGNCVLSRLMVGNDLHT
eukprot:scaffold1729_cov117-Cylindrotheca_fusiformis.AAC.4